MNLRGKFLSAGIVIALVALPTVAMAATTTLEVTKEGATVTAIQSGDVINVTSTSPIDATGVISQMLASVWSKQSLQLTDTSSIVLPEGWTLQYTTDSETWSSDVPADLTTVTGLRAVGDVTTKGKNLFETTATGQIVVTQSNFQGSSGGDGYDLTFGGERVFNIFHHDSQLRVDCHIKSTGASCYGGATVFPGYQTGNASSSYWEAKSSTLWAVARRVSDAQGGLVCVDYSDAAHPKLCATSFVALGTVTSSQALSTSTRVGKNVYIVNESTWKLMCADITTGVACENNGFQLPSTGAAPDLASYGRVSNAGDGRVYWSTYNKMGCYNPATNELCGTELTVSAVAAQYPLFPIRDAAGALLGMCMYHTKQCINGAGEAVDVIPAALSTWMSSNSLPQWNTFNAGAWAEQNNRIYLNDGPSGTASRDVYCFNYTTGAECADFSGRSVGTEIYAIIADPSIPNCMWTNGNAGQITTFNGRTGLPGCSLDYPIVEMPYAAVTPRLACNESGRVLTWDKITFGIPEGLTAAQLNVTILDESGSPIEGWIDRKPNSSGVLDMSGLSIETSGTKPTIQVNAGTVEESLLALLTVNAKFEAEDPQLCFNLTVVPTCPEFTPVGGDLSVPDGLIQTAAISTTSAGKTVAAGEANASLTGTNTETLCTASIAKVALPTLDDTEEELADTGADSGVVALAVLALMMLVAGSVLVTRANR